jgi:archaemetzincin
VKPSAPIHILPIGDGVRLEQLDDLSAALARRFRVSCRVRTGPIDTLPAFNAARGQYLSTCFLEQLMPLAGDTHRLLGVTALDLFVPILTFVFGEAQLEGGCAVVSTYRLREELYGLPPRPDLLFERLVKESVHELGHTFGLKHCSDWRCVMASTHAVERLDLKSDDFCPHCGRQVRGSALP